MIILDSTEILELFDVKTSIDWEIINFDTGVGEKY